MKRLLIASLLAMVGVLLLLGNDGTARASSTVVTFEDDAGVAGSIKSLKTWTEAGVVLASRVINRTDVDKDGDLELTVPKAPGTVTITMADGSNFTLTSIDVDKLRWSSCSLRVSAGKSVTVDISSVGTFWFSADFSDVSSVTIDPISGEKLGCTGSIDNITIGADTRADILIGSGVPGKGLADAPGLQKEFNPESAAAEHAGK